MDDTTFDLYKDIQIRTGGEIYIGVVGPVRTGKSTFIKRFMDLMVLPHIEGEHELNRTKDELPQSAGGRTITTTEPKFIPKEAAQISLDDSTDTKAKVRLIDCVGYMVEGAAGHIEGAEERMVKTPWFDYEIPYENYIAPQQKTIAELKALQKPFIVLVNSSKPYSEEANRIAQEIRDSYQVAAMPVNCEQLKKEDIHKIMETILYEFPLSAIEFYMPKWMELLPKNHKVKTAIVVCIRDLLKQLNTVRDVVENGVGIENEYVRRCKVDLIDMSSGCVKVNLDVGEEYYYEMLSDLLGESIHSEYQMIAMLREMVNMRHEYVKVLNALEAVRYKGYGVVTPDRCEITLAEPEMIKHGNKFGVKIKAESPSVHMIKANIETEIAPIVGSEEQAEDLMKFISQAKDTEEGIWETNIFGKSIGQLVNDGIASKISMIGDESQLKLQETMQKIVNDSSGGLICIII